MISPSLPTVSEPFWLSSNAGEGVAEGVRFERFHASHALFGIELGAVFCAPGDSGVIAGDGIYFFDRRICAVADDRAGIEQAAPNIGAGFGTLRAEAQDDIRCVGGAVNGLHGGNDAELAETGDIGRINVLGVFDAPAKVMLVGIRLECLFVDIEDFAVGAIANGVDTKLETVGHGDLGGLREWFPFFRCSCHWWTGDRNKVRASRRRVSRGRRRRNV